MSRKQSSPRPPLPPQSRPQQGPKCSTSFCKSPAANGAESGLCKLHHELLLFMVESFSKVRLAGRDANGAITQITIVEALQRAAALVPVPSPEVAAKSKLVGPGGRTLLQ